MLPEVFNKTKEVARYIIEHVKPENLGAVRLNKVMWLADKKAIEKFGKTITGQYSYVKMPLGPVPNKIENILKSLEDTGVLKRSKQIVYDFEVTCFNATNVKTIYELTNEEISIIDYAISEITAKTATKVSEETHGLYWESLNNGEQMNIGAASLVFEDITESDLKALLAAE